MATHFTFLGHAGVSVQTASGKTILIDPWLSGNPVATQSVDDIAACDLLLLTHAHGDHTGDVLTITKKFRPIVVAIYDLTTLLGKMGVENTVGINKGGGVEISGIRVTGTHAFHSSTLTMPDGTVAYAGEPMGFVVDADGFRFYHAGDTALFGDMELIAKFHSPELAFLPIGDHFTMNPREAAYAAKLLGVKSVVPIHWGTFPILTGTPAQLRESLAGTGIQCVELEPGESLSV